MSVEEVPLRETRYGLVADGDGWFVINARESAGVKRATSASTATSRVSAAFANSGST
jgi:predicted nucleic acid-binding Zn ribbon protein